MNLPNVDYLAENKAEKQLKFGCPKDEWVKEETLHGDVFTGNCAKSWIDSNDLIKPVFLEVGFPGPHEPDDPPERFLEM